MPDAKVAWSSVRAKATGGAIARGFARDGYAACITRRHADKLSPLVREIEAAGRRVRAFGSDARKAEAVAALVEEIERNIGPIEVAIHNIGAKHALRALAQSMARELGPRGIHVAHVVIDGAIDTDFIRAGGP
jgi:NAD(P)-dependent dehydrogenase (short-subunit alcohol dehydrogenase family)